MGSSVQHVIQTLIQIVLIQSSPNLVRSCIWMISRSSSSMGHAESKTRSQGLLVHFKDLASCPDTNSNSFNQIFTKHSLKLYLDDGLFVKHIFFNAFTISQTGVFCDRLHSCLE